MRIIFGWAIRLFCPTKILGPKKLDRKKTLLAINHYSNFDPIIVACHIKPQLHFWAKQELFKNKFLGWFLRRLGVVPIKRGEADISSVKAALTLLKNEKIFALFPEGTRNKENADAEMLQIRHGLAMLAIKSKAPIRVALFYRKPKFLRRNYFIIGEEFELSQYYGQRVNNDLLDEATKIVEEQFEILHKKLNDFLIEKGVKKVENTST